MATAQTIFNRALRLIGVLPSGESPASGESSDGLIAVNALLESWQNERLMCYAQRDESVTLSSGNTSRTIGPSGNVTSTRPVEIIDAFVTYSSMNYPVRIINAQEWDAITDRSATAPWPDRIYYEPSMSNGTIYLFPVPNASSTLHIRTRTPLTAFSAISDTVTLPQGWERALAYNLAVEVAPEYDVDPRPGVIRIAQNSKRLLKRTNSRSIKGYSQLRDLVGTRRSNILTDQP